MAMSLEQLENKCRMYQAIQWFYQTRKFGFFLRLRPLILFLKAKKKTSSKHIACRACMPAGLNDTSLWKLALERSVMNITFYCKYEDGSDME